MIHHGQSLAFSFETGHDVFGVQSKLDDFQRHPSFDRFELFGRVAPNPMPPSPIFWRIL